MKIAVLGPGCPKCKKLYENAQQAVAEAGVEADLEKVEDIQKIKRIQRLHDTGAGCGWDGQVHREGCVSGADQEVDRIRHERTT